MSNYRKSFPKASVKELHKESNTLFNNNGFFSMSNWFIVLVVVLPALFSRATMDPVLTVRYIFLCWFILFFVYFFYGVQKKEAFHTLPFSIKIVFGLEFAYGLWSMVCMFFAINMATAGYEVARHFLNIILLFMAMETVKQDERQVLKLCKALVIVSMFQSAVGILQHYELDFINVPGTRSPYGLMAHRNLFASAQVLIIPFILYVLYKGAKGWKLASIVALTGVIISIVISQTRSAWLATIVLGIIAFVLTILLSITNRKKWITGTITGLCGIILLTIMLLISDKEGSFSKSIQKRAFGLIKPSSDSSSSSLTANARLIYWNKSILLIKDKPVFGVGAGNWNLAILAYGTEGTDWEGSYWHADHAVPSWPHNVYLQVASETGIFGALLYFGVWIVITILALKIILKPPSEDIRILNILMLAGLAAFATDCMFSFPTERIEHSLYIILTAGIILGSYVNISASAKENEKRRKWIVLPISLIVIFNLFIAYKKFSFEKHMNLAKMYRNENRFEEVIEEVNTAKSRFVTLDPNGEPLEIHSGAAYIGLKNYPKALDEIQIAKSYHPNNSRIYTTMGVAYAYLEQYDNAINSYLQALKLTPDYIVAIRNLGVIYFKTANYVDCIRILDKPYFNNDEYIKSLVNEARTQLKDGNLKYK